MRTGIGRYMKAALLAAVGYSNMRACRRLRYPRHCKEAQRTVIRYTPLRGAMLLWRRIILW